MKRKLLFLSIALFGALHFTIAQSDDLLLKHIPSDAISVLTIHGKRIDLKTNIKKLNENESFSSSQAKILNSLFGEANYNSDDFKTLLGSFGTYGLDFISNSYLFMQIEQDFYAVSYIFKIKDASKFNNFTDNFFQKDRLSKIDLPASVNGYKMPFKDVNIVWTDSYGIITAYGPKRENNMFASNPFDKKDEKNIHFIINNYVKELINQDPEFCIANNKTFKENYEMGGDLVIWFNNAMQSKFRNDNVPGLAIFDPVYAKLDEIYAGSTTNISISLTNHGMTAAIEGIANKDLLKHHKNFLNSSFDSDLFKYMPKDSLIIAMGVSLNMEAIEPYLTDIIYPMIKEIPMYGERATDVMDILGVVTDEDALYDLVEGDFVFLLSGKNSYQKTTTVTDYDDDYNPIEVEKTTTESYPKFTWMMSTKDDKTWDKFIGLYSMDRLLTKKDDYYYYQSRWDKNGVKIFYAAKNGVVIVSTDEALMTKHLKKGYPASQQISGDIKKMFTSNNMVVYAQPVDFFKDQEGNNEDFETIYKALDGSNVEFLKYSGATIKKNKSISTMELKFGDGELNAINFIFQMIDQISSELIQGEIEAEETTEYDDYIIEEAIPVREYEDY